MTSIDAESIQQRVRETYGRLAETGRASRCQTGASDPQSQSTCCPDPAVLPAYSATDLQEAPAGSNLGLGCGNPLAITGLQAGQTVLDLGSGGGFDCFLAARQVGAQGKVIGVDMTPEMVNKARTIARREHFTNVEFRLGEIEHLPVADQSIDVILSNCVINLSVDKRQVFREAFRVLKPGGRLAIMDIVATAEIPEAVKNNLELYSACISGAMETPVLKNLLTETGFEAIRITLKSDSRDCCSPSETESPGNYLGNASVEATRPPVGKVR